MVPLRLIVLLLSQVSLSHALEAMCYGEPGVDLPLRYFFVQLTEKGANLTASVGKLRVASKNYGSKCRSHHSLTDRGDGLYIVRVHIYNICDKIDFDVFLVDLHLCGLEMSNNDARPLTQEECVCDDIPKSPEWIESAKCEPEPQLENDLKRFASIDFVAVLKEAEERFGQERHSRTYSICHYAIKSNELYRKCYGEYVGFHSFSDEMLLSLLRRMKVPDTHFIMNLGDYPLSLPAKHDSNPLPIVSWCGSDESVDIVLPTYSLSHTLIRHERWTGLHNALGDSPTPWANKLDQAIFRGRDSNQLRLDLSRLSASYPFVDAGITRYFFFEEAKNTNVKPSIPSTEFFKYRFVISIDGTVAAYRLPFLLSGDSVVLKSDSQYYEHFYSRLEPYKHYIPFNKKNMKQVFEWVQGRDFNETISNMKQFARDHLQPRNIMCYYARFMEQPTLDAPRSRLARMRSISKPPPELAKQWKLQEARTQVAEDTRIDIDGDRVMWTVGPSVSVEENDIEESCSSALISQRQESGRREGSTSLPDIQPILRIRHASHSTDDHLSQSFDSRKRTPMKNIPSKLSLMQRFSRMISNDDLENDKRNGTGTSLDSNDILSDSPSTSNAHLSFLQRIRTTLGKGERDLLCSSTQSYPVSVISCISGEWNARERKRERRHERKAPPSARLTFHQHHRSERLHSLFGSTGELQPLEMKEDEEFTYGHLLKLRRNRKMSISVGDRKGLRRSIDRLDTFTESLHGIAEAADADDVVTAYRHGEYDPKTIGEIEAATRTTVRGVGFVCTVHHSTVKDEEKKILNERFKTKFPDIKLTFSKLRSIKREIVEVALACKVDMTTVAHSFVYFERVVLQGRIAKWNRKEIAVACFILAVKICEPQGIELKQCFEKAESIFRISRSDILSFELPICLALSFQLMPPAQQVMPHYHRLQIALTF